MATPGRRLPAHIPPQRIVAAQNPSSLLCVAGDTEDSQPRIPQLTTSRTLPARFRCLNASEDPDYAGTNSDPDIPIGISIARGDCISAGSSTLAEESA